MIGNLLVDTNTIITYVLLGVVVLLFVGWFVFSGRKNKQRQKNNSENQSCLHHLLRKKRIQFVT